MRKVPLVAILTSAMAMAQAPGLYFESQQVVNSTASGASWVAAADLDGDGDLDIISVAELSHELVWQANEGGAFGTPQTLATTANGTVDPGDFDNDGDTDLLFTASGGVFLCANLATGFSIPFSIVPTPATQALWADMDADGDLDVVAATSGGAIWCENLGFGFFGTAHMITSNFATEVRVVDIDLDGDLDVFARSFAQIELALNTQLLFASQTLLTGNFQQQLSAMGLADMDNDGDLDLLVGIHGFNISPLAYGSLVNCYRNLGAASGTFTYSFNIWTSSIDTTPKAVTAIAAADLDHDGDDDLLVTRQDNIVRRYRVDGWSVFESSELVGPTSLPKKIVTADLDGDGFADALLASRDDNKVAWYRNSTILPVTSSATAFGTGCGSPPLTLTANSTAILGSNTTSTISNTPTPVCVVSLGFSNRLMAGGVSLPVDLGSLGMTSCTLWHSSEVFGLSTSASGQPFVMTSTFFVPYAATLRGARVFTQAFSYAPGVNPAALLSSNGLNWLIGDL